MPCPSLTISSTRKKVTFPVLLRIRNCDRHARKFDLSCRKKCSVGPNFLYGGKFCPILHFFLQDRSNFLACLSHFLILKSTGNVTFSQCSIPLESNFVMHWLFDIIDLFYEYPLPVTDVMLPFPCVMLLIVEREGWSPNVIMRFMMP